MCAYNAVNGVPMCANKPFLSGLARAKWGFDGYITSDCDAVANVMNPHNYTATMSETISVVLDAGMDLDCGESMSPGALAEALAEGYVSARQLDAALWRLFSVQFRLGMFDPAWRQGVRRIGPEAVDSAAHRQLALLAVVWRPAAATALHPLVWAVLAPWRADFPPRARRCAAPAAAATAAGWAGSCATASTARSTSAARSGATRRRRRRARQRSWARRCGGEVGPASTTTGLACQAAVIRFANVVPLHRGCPHSA